MILVPVFLLKKVYYTTIKSADVKTPTIRHSIWIDCGLRKQMQERRSVGDRDDLATGLGALVRSRTEREVVDCVCG